MVKCSNVLKLIIYADDTNVFTSSSSLYNNIDVVNTELEHVNSWVHDNALTVNVQKSQYVVFSRKRRNIGNCNSNVSINRVELDSVSSVRFLGVILDENLMWSSHVNYVTRKLSKFVPLLYSLRNNLTLDALKLIYNSLI